jgi:hypothetical protein
VRLLEAHPELFDLAQKYEDESQEIKGGHFQWNDDMTLRELRKPENIEKIKQRYEQNRKRRWETRPNKKLVETLADLQDLEDDTRACTICHL